MAWRLCAAFCFAVALGLAWLPTIEYRRLHEGMRSDHWIDRANSAALVRFCGREARPQLIALLDDLNPRVRENAKASLHRITGWPWATAEEECRRAAETSAAAPGPRTLRPLDPEKSLELAVVRAQDGAIHVVVVNRTGHPVVLETVPLETYPASLYGRTGQAVQVLHQGARDSAVVDVGIYTAGGVGVARFWWRLSTAKLDVDGWLTETYELEFLPPGRYVAEVSLGTTGCIRPAPEPSVSPWMDASAEQRVVLVLDR